MELPKLGQDRFLRRDANQKGQTKDPVFASQNPTPPRGNDELRKIGRPKGSEEDDGAPNILTGTVIISCFIQTSALPSRIELQGNDITFFDDTFEQNGQVVGDTARLVFTHGSGKSGEIISQGFIIEKRASVFNTYDNVISWYALPARQEANNYMFIGRSASGNDSQRNLNSMHFAVNNDTGFTQPSVSAGPLNGVFNFEYSVDGVFVFSPLSLGSTKSLYPTFGLGGFSAVISAGDGGLTGFGYKTATGGLAVLLYLLSENEITLGQKLIPDADATYDIGSPTFRVRNIYASGGIGIGASGGITWTSGTGSPEGVVTAPIGSLYSNVSGGASTTLYVKTSGSGNTGWTAK